MGGGGEDIEYDPSFIYGNRDMAVQFLDRALANALPYSEDYTQRAIDAFKQETEKARDFSELYYEKGQALSEPFRLAGYDSYDMYLDSIGVARPEVGSKLIATALEKEAEDKQFRDELTKHAYAFQEMFPFTSVGLEGAAFNPGPGSQLQTAAAISQGLSSPGYPGYRADPGGTVPGYYPEGVSGVEQYGGEMFPAYQRMRGQTLETPYGSYTVPEEHGYPSTAAYAGSITAAYPGLSRTDLSQLRPAQQAWVEAYGPTHHTLTGVRGNIKPPMEYLAQMIPTFQDLVSLGGISRTSGTQVLDPGAMQRAYDFLQAVGPQYREYQSFLANYSPELQNISRAVETGNYGPIQEKRVV